MRPINEIIIHCSATRPEWMAGAKTSAKVTEIRRWHKVDRGWRDIGYHLLIDRDGTIAKGRPMDEVGAHVAGHNTGTIGVCLIGGHGSAETDQFAQHFTASQEAALRKVLRDLRSDFPSIAKVSGHNEYAAKACPGFNVPLWLGWHVSKPPSKPVADSPAPNPAVKPDSGSRVTETAKTEHDRTVPNGDPRSDWWAGLVALFSNLFRRK